MKRKALLLLTLFALTLTLNAQTFIGMTREEVQKTMKRDKPEFSYDQSVKNDRFDYLKYCSDDKLETWIIVFDENGICRGVRETCDNSLQSIKRNKLDAFYQKNGRNKWSFVNDKCSILVEMKNEKWYFTITYKQAQKL